MRKQGEKDEWSGQREARKRKENQNRKRKRESRKPTKMEKALWHTEENSPEMVENELKQ